jgi:hypothetical protein
MSLLLFQNFLIIPCPVAVVHCSFHSMSSNTSLPAAVSPSLSVNFRWSYPQAQAHVPQLVQGRSTLRIFSVVNRNLSYWIKILGLGANDVVRNDLSRGLLIKMSAVPKNPMLAKSASPLLCISHCIATRCYQPHGTACAVELVPAAPHTWHQTEDLQRNSFTPLFSSL